MVLALARDSDEHALDALVRSEGSAGEAWIAHLLDACDPRDLSDAAHGLCKLYGSHPTCIDTAALRVVDPLLTPLLRHAAEGFTAERNYLAAVVAAAGPTPSTPGQAQSEAALVGQRHALEALASSDRIGCAIGAAFALVVDWHAVRPILDLLAGRAGITVPSPDLPGSPPLRPPGRPRPPVRRASAAHPAAPAVVAAGGARGRPRSTLIRRLSEAPEAQPPEPPPGRSGKRGFLGARACSRTSCGHPRR